MVEDSGLRRPFGCTTIDNDENDLKGLVCARAALRSAGRHSSTAEAVSRLLDCAGRCKEKRPANLFGHGIRGRIGTGSGKSRHNDPQKYIGLDNTKTWEPLIAQLKGHFDSLILWACDVGAGTEGADLLFRLATVLDAPVEAPTNILRCEARARFSIFDDGSWQTAWPNQPKPRGINVRTSTGRSVSEIEGFDFDDTSDESYTIPFEVEGRAFRVLTADIESVECYDGTKEAPIKVLDDSQIARLPSLIDFSSWVRPGGPILAIHTGTLILRYKFHGKEHTAQFDLYNDRLLHDATTPGHYGYYHTVEGLLKRLERP